MLRDAGAAARAPGHDVVPLVQPASLVDCLQEVPDRVVVLIGHREIRVIPVHPVPKADRLLGDAFGKRQHPLLASLDEFGNAELLDVSLALEAKVLLDFDFDPKSLAVEAVLIALALTEHGLIALEEILVGSTPGVMHTHGVVRRNWTIEKRVPLR